MGSCPPCPPPRRERVELGGPNIVLFCFWCSSNTAIKIVFKGTSTGTGGRPGLVLRPPGAGPALPGEAEPVMDAAPVFLTRVCGREPARPLASARPAAH